MNRIENAGQVKTGYSVKSGTNSEEKVGNGSDFASMLTKYKKKAETGETKNKETQPEETKNRGNEKQVNGRQSGENEKQLK